MIPDIEQIKKNYKKLPDSQLLTLALNKADTLRPDALEVLLEEIKNRGIDINTDEAVAVQVGHVNDDVIEELAELIRKLKCPHCNDEEGVNMIITKKVTSILVMTTSKEKAVFGCNNCLNTFNDDALASSAIAGWWGFPWGLIRTPIAINRGLKNKKIIQETDDKYLKEFVINNRGLITYYKNDPEKLQYFISTV